MKKPVFRAGPCWKVAAAENFSAFVRALTKLELEQALLCIEGGCAAPKDLDLYLRQKANSGAIRITGGTILPSPVAYCVPATSEILNRIAAIMENLSTPIGSVHIHIVQDDNILLQWFDAFLDPIWISSAVPESSVEAFAQALGGSYTSDVC